MCALLPACATSHVLDRTTLPRDPLVIPISGSYGGNDALLPLALALAPYSITIVQLALALSFDALTLPYQVWQGYPPYDRLRICGDRRA